MSTALKSALGISTILLATALLGCEEKKEEPAPAKATASVAAAPATTSAKPKPKPKPREDCPDGSSGIGTFEEPCKGSGASRMMKVEYSGKTTEKGPKFAITNLTDKPILHGSISVYFYDKAGKQLKAGDEKKPRSKLGCSGNIFAGMVKPEEKIWMFFSCVKKDDVPAGAEFIEGEVQRVGFANADGTQNEFYWRNEDLVPDERPKGGIQEDAKKK
jgi:hypothetical protein